MFRLMSMTFYGPYRGPAWAGAPPARRGGQPHATQEAAAHGVKHPADPHAHGQAHRDDHEVSHGPAHHAAWHGPHDAPRAMTWPLMALAVGAIVAGYVGWPKVFGGTDTIGRFLEPSFAAHVAAGQGAAEPGTVEAGTMEPEALHMSAAGEVGLMILSSVLAIVGMWLAWRFYVKTPEISARLAERWAGAHRLLTNKYYVDELYDATVVRGTLEGGRGLWSFDMAVVDGAVNGSGWLTRVSSWVSHLFDKHVVDGLVNFVGWGTGESSFVFRRAQTGLIQNYALLMLAGVFVFLSVYLLAR
jgi:NADH-quinone oxidoreductase subunit L